MTFEVLVAKIDGGPGVAGVGGIVDVEDAVPVTRDFNSRLPIGTARLHVEGNDVYATLDLQVPRADIAHCVPAIGGIANVLARTNDPRRTLAGFKVFEVSLCDQPNIDPRIPPIGDGE